MNRRVVITGCGVISPLGSSVSDLWQGLQDRKSGVSTLKRLPYETLPISFGGESWQFDEKIDSFGPLEPAVKKQIRKGLKVMCREIKMGVAAAQLALNDSAIDLDAFDRNRVGCVYGSDFITTEPHEFVDAVRACLKDGKFSYDAWAEVGLSQVTPLWLLKYLPNMPACHVAIYNDLRGPNNSLTVREASSNLAIAESVATIQRGAADVTVTGATGSRIHPLRTVHAVMQEQLAIDVANAGSASRPFDKDRQGMVIGEGAAALVLEELEIAKARNAKILAEVVGYGASSVMDKDSIANRDVAIANSIRQALSIAKMDAASIGHYHAHGLGTPNCDREEASAVNATLPGVAVVAAKSNFGNLGAASGLVESICSVVALSHKNLFATLNYETPDPDCPLNVVTDADTPSGDSFINVNVSPQGQASSILVKRYLE